MNHAKTIIGVLFAGAGAAAVWYATRGHKAAIPGSQPAPALQSPIDGQQSSSFAQESDQVAYVNELKTWQPPQAAAPYLSAIAIAEAKYGLPVNLLARLLHQESRFRQDIITGQVKSSAGALGIAQFMPATAADFGIDPLNPFQSIDAAGKYLKQLYKRFGNWQEALASYNWGQGNVARKGLAQAPTETRNYFAQIMADIGLG